MSAADPASLEAELAAWVEGLLSRAEPVWYCWGGSESPDTGLDCSGLVCWAARQISTPLPLGRPNTDALWRDLIPVPAGEERAGQLAIYGTGDVADPACHVMVRLADGRVAGMSRGGRATTSLALAKVHDARLRAYGSPLYRKDFLGWRRLDFSKTPGVST